MRTTPESREQARQNAAWPVSVELAALRVDLLAIIAAERRLKKPFEVPRPEWMRPSAAEGVQRAVAILKANAGPGRVRVHPAAPQGAT